MPSREFIIAVLLFLGTLLTAYVGWYVFRGRHDRKRKALEDLARTANERATRAKKKSEPKKGKDGDWQVDKGAYCYPAINDVMGYDFVKVVKVPEHLTAPKDPPKPAREETEEKHNDWASSSGTGLVTESNDAVTTTSYGGRRNRTEEDETFPASAPARETDQGRQQVESEVADSTVTSEISSEDLQDMQNMQSWPVKDESDNVAIEEELMRQLQDDPDSVEEIDEAAWEENERVALEAAALQKELEKNASAFMDNYYSVTDNSGSKASFGKNLLDDTAEETE